MNSIEQRQGKNVAAFRNRDFMYLWTMTGFGLLFNDPRIPAKLLALDESTKDIGVAVVQALNESTVLTSESFQEIFHSGEIQKKGSEWDSFLVKKYSYRSSKGLYKYMHKCTISEVGGSITFSPSLHDDFESWSGISAAEDVVLPSTSSSEEIGLALLEAFNRCNDAWSAP